MDCFSRIFVQKALAASEKNVFSNFHNWWKNYFPLFLEAKIRRLERK